MIGNQYPQPDPRGWLVFESLPPDLQLAEDSTQDADVARAEYARYPRFSRTATAAERVLLEHLGYELPDELTTAVTMLTAGIRHRAWPQLEGQTP
jgi:hypothetical protein